MLRRYNLCDVETLIWSGLITYIANYLFKVHANDLDNFVSKLGLFMEMETKAGKQKKRSVDSDDDVSRERRPKRATSGTNFKEKSLRFSEKYETVEAKKEQIVGEEIVAIQ